MLSKALSVSRGKGLFVSLAGQLLEGVSLLVIKRGTTGNFPFVFFFAFFAPFCGYPLCFTFAPLRLCVRFSVLWLRLRRAVLFRGYSGSHLSASICVHLRLVCKINLVSISGTMIQDEVFAWGTQTNMNFVPRILPPVEKPRTSAKPMESLLKM